MTYRDWNQRVSFVCAQFRWYRLTDLLTFVDDLRRCILESIGKISEVRCPPLEPLGEPPAQPNLRFPESDTFVCDGVGDWADRIDALLLARSLILYPNKLLRRYPDILTQGEAELYALHLINQFMRDVFDMNDVIDQREFEQLFDLQWQDDSDGLAGPIEETMPVEQGSDNSSKEERVVLNKRKE